MFILFLIPIVNIIFFNFRDAEYGINLLVREDNVIFISHNDAVMVAFN